MRDVTGADPAARDGDSCPLSVRGVGLSTCPHMSSVRPDRRRCQMEIQSPVLALTPAGQGSASDAISAEVVLEKPSQSAGAVRPGTVPAYLRSRAIRTSSVTSSSHAGGLSGLGSSAVLR